MAERRPCKSTSQHKICDPNSHHPGDLQHLSPKMVEVDNEAEIDMEDAPSSRGKQKPARGQEITTTTIKAPPFSYAFLELISESANQIKLDELTVRSYITAALTQFLGLTGSAISVDILKVEGTECWIRVPREDLKPVIAAVGGWVGGTEPHGLVGWRVKSSGNWLNVLVANMGAENIWK